MQITFRPVLEALYRGLAPALRVRDQGAEFLFECLDDQCVVQVSTVHVTLADALRQVANRMGSDSRFLGQQIRYEQV